MKHRNRRKAKRFSLDYIYCRTDPDLEGFSVVKDLSMLGAQVLTRQPPPIGSPIQLRFDQGVLAGHRVQGRVVRHNRQGDQGFGVKFDTPAMRLLLSAVGRNEN